MEASNIGSLPAAPDPLLLSKSWQSWTQMIGAQVGTQGPRQSPSGTMNFKEVLHKRGGDASPPQVRGVFGSWDPLHFSL